MSLGTLCSGIKTLTLQSEGIRGGGGGGGWKRYECFPLSNGKLRDSNAATKRGDHRFLVTSNANIYFALIYGRTPLRRFFEQESNRKARSLLVDNFFQSKLSLPFNSQGTKDTAAASIRTAVKEEEGESERA